MMLFYTYILYSSVKDKFYIGHTENVQNRLLQHNTRNNLGTNDWIVIYTESFDNRSDAMKREKEIKNKKSRKYIEWLIQEKG
jgi:putative endonuclease